MPPPAVQVAGSRLGVQVPFWLQHAPGWGHWAVQSCPAVDTPLAAEHALGLSRAQVPSGLQQREGHAAAWQSVPAEVQDPPAVLQSAWRSVAQVPSGLQQAPALGSEM